MTVKVFEVKAREDIAQDINSEPEKFTLLMDMLKEAVAELDNPHQQAEKGAVEHIIKQVDLLRTAFWRDVCGAFLHPDGSGRLAFGMPWEILETLGKEEA